MNLAVNIQTDNRWILVLVILALIWIGSLALCNEFIDDPTLFGFMVWIGPLTLVGWIAILLMDRGLEHALLFAFVIILATHL